MQILAGRDASREREGQDHAVLAVRVHVHACLWTRGCAGHTDETNGRTHRATTTCAELRVLDADKVLLPSFSHIEKDACVLQLYVEN